MRRIHPFAPAYGVAALAAFAGSLLVVGAAEHRLDDQFEANGRLRAAIDDARAAVAQRAASGAKLERLRSDLGRALWIRDATARSATFVRDAAQIALHHGTHVASIVAAARIERLTPQSGATAAGPRETAYDVTLEGRYVDVLATLRAFAQLRPPAAIELTGLSRKNPNAPDPTLIAALRVSLGRFTAAEPADVPAALP